MVIFFAGVRVHLFEANGGRMPPAYLLSYYDAVVTGYQKTVCRRAVREKRRGRILQRRRV